MISYRPITGGMISFHPIRYKIMRNTTQSKQDNIVYVVWRQEGRGTRDPVFGTPNDSAAETWAAGANRVVENLRRQWPKNDQLPASANSPECLHLEATIEVLQAELLCYDPSWAPGHPFDLTYTAEPLAMIDDTKLLGWNNMISYHMTPDKCSTRDKTSTEEGREV